MNMRANSNHLSLALTTLALATTSFSQTVSAATLYSVLDLGYITASDSDYVSVVDINSLSTTKVATQRTKIVF